MRPTDEHQRVIARIVDRFDSADLLNPSVIDHIFDSIDFTLTHAHGEFLIEYIRRRVKNGLAKGEIIRHPSLFSRPKLD